MSGCRQTGWQLATILVRERLDTKLLKLSARIFVRSWGLVKDSMSMKMKWKSNGEDKEVTEPVSLVVTAFAAVEHVGKTWLLR